MNIRNDDIADGNPKLTLGLIWTIILHFQVEWLPLGVSGVAVGSLTGSGLDFWLGCGSGGGVFLPAQPGLAL